MAIGKFTIQKLINYIQTFGGGKITTQDEGDDIDTNVTKLNFIGASVEVADAGSGVSNVTINADAGYEKWVLEDGDGTEVNITNDKEVKFVDGNGLHINWHPDGDGSDSTPYLMEFTASYENINDLTTVTIASGDYLIVQDVNDSNNPKKGLVSDIATDAAGSDTQIQYNNGGTAFGGIADLTWDDTDVKIGGSSGTTKLLFGDAGTYINQSADAALAVVSDGTVTVDAGTDIVLDADGDDITFKAGSADSTGLKFTQSNTGDWTVLLGTSNKDLIFNVNDGGAATEVCRLDGDVSALKVASSKKLMLGAAEEYVYGDGTDIHFGVGANGDINIPANIGLTFGDDGEKIEGDGTDLTIAGNNINLTAVADVVVPANVGITFGTGEKIEGNNTDLTVTSGADINLTATGDVNIPSGVGITFGDDGEKIEGDGTDLTIAGNNINLTAVADVVIPADVGITFGTGEKIEGNNTDLTITSGADINLTATADVNIPSGVGITFGDDGEKIEGNGTDLTIASSNLLNLTATTDVVIPVNVGLHFGDGNEKIESDNTDLTINSGVDINLTATGDVNIPANVGITFGDDGEKIEGDGTDLTIAGNNINLTAVADVVIPANVGITFGSGEKIEGNNTDLTVTSGADINLTATGDVNIPADVGVTFGHASADKIEGDGSGMTITSQALDIATTSVSVSSATSEKPEFELKNTNNDANGAILKFNKDGANAADNDVLGSIDFAGENDNGTPEAITYAQISAKSTDVSDGNEDGKIEFIVKNAGSDNTLMSLASNTVTIAGDLTVNGTTTHINSTVATIEDPVLNIGGGTDGAAPGSDDNKDRGIEFQYHNGAAAKIGFFGFDDSTSRLVYIPDASNSSEVFSGNRGNIEAAGMYVTTDGSTVGIQIGVTSDTEIDTAAGNLTIDSAGGTTTIDDDCTVSGGLTVNGGDATITAANDAAASILMQADNSDDAGDDWKIIANADQTFTIGNDKASAGTSVAHLTITPDATVADSTVAVAGILKLGGNEIQASDGGAAITLDTSDNVTIAGDLTVSGNDIKGSGGTAITMDGSNNVTVAADLSVGDDLSLTSDSSVFNMGAGNDFTITHDGTTGATLAGTPISINSTGDLTLDSTTDIVVDAAGGNVEFKDAGALQLTLDMDTTAGQVDIQLGVDSDDLVFKQYDGNEVIRIADDRRLYFYDQGGEYISSDGSTLTVAGDAVTVESAADIILDADGGNVTLKDGDTTYLDIGQSSGNCIFSASADTKDLIFHGDDATEVFRVDGSEKSILLASSKKLMIGAPEEYLYGDGTDIHFGVGSGGDINVPANIGVTFGHATGDKIEGDGSSMTITSQEFTLDCAGDIIFDADGGNVTLEDGGTTYLDIIQSGGNCIFSSSADTKDLIFHGDDATEVFRVDGSAKSLLIASTKKIEFTDTNAYIHHDGTDLKLADDADINLVAGADILLDAATTIKVDSAAGDVSFEVGGTAQLAVDMDGTAGQVDIQLKVDSDDLVFKQYDGNEVIRIADDRRLYFYDQGGEYISSDGTDLSIAAGTAINVLAGTIDSSNQAVAWTLNSNTSALNFGSNLLNIDKANDRVGIGTATPAGPFHILSGSTNEPQFTLGYDATHYAEFAISSAHDLTITPSSTGQVILQPTTDTTDFFQVLDANGGTSILQVDATNEMVGVGIDPPLVALDVHYKQAPPTSLANDTGGGEVVYFGGGTTVIGKLYYLGADGNWTATDADSVDSGAESMLAIALGTAPGTHGMLIRGWFDAHSYLSNFESGMAVFVSTTAGQMDTTSPSGCGDYVRIVGHCTNTANAIYFNPSAVWVEIATS